jgi:BTB/POZ domain
LTKKKLEFHDYLSTVKANSLFFLSFQLFRCHKAFLASNSEAFDKMLYGYFKETNVDRDFEICMSETSPDVFDLAMRCSNFNHSFKLWN